jgi:hypothetical protein
MVRASADTSTPRRMDPTSKDDSMTGRTSTTISRLPVVVVIGTVQFSFVDDDVVETLFLHKHQEKNSCFFFMASLLVAGYS